MTEEIFKELKEIIEYRSRLREFEMWLYTFIEEYNVEKMTIQEFYNKIRKMVEKEEGY